MLAEDEEHGEANKAVMQQWLATWTPASVEAARKLQPVWSLPAEKAMRFEDSYERSSQRFKELLSDIGLDTPKEA